MLVLRDARPDDAPELVRVRIETWQRAYRGCIDDAYLDAMKAEDEIPSCRTKIEHLAPHHAYKVALLGHQLVGFAFGMKDVNDTSKRLCELHALYVDTAHQHQGIGKALTCAFAQHMLGLGASQMVIWTLKEGPSHAFYRSTGGLLLPQSKPYELAGRTYECIGYHYPSLAQLISHLGTPGPAHS